MVARMIVPPVAIEPVIAIVPIVVPAIAPIVVDICPIILADVVPLIPIVDAAGSITGPVPFSWSIRPIAPLAGPIGTILAAAAFSGTIWPIAPSRDFAATGALARASLSWPRRERAGAITPSGNFAAAGRCCASWPGREGRVLGRLPPPIPSPPRSCKKSAAAPPAKAPPASAAPVEIPAGLVLGGAPGREDRESRSIGPAKRVRHCCQSWDDWQPCSRRRGQVGPIASDIAAAGSIHSGWPCSRRGKLTNRLASAAALPIDGRVSGAWPASRWSRAGDRRRASHRWARTAAGSCATATTSSGAATAAACTSTTTAAPSATPHPAASPQDSRAGKTQEQNHRRRKQTLFHRRTFYVYVVCRLGE